MATANPSIAGTWIKIAEAEEDFFFSLRTGANINHVLPPVEIAITDADAAPGVMVAGRLIDPHGNEGINRALTGPGHVWARCALAGYSIQPALDVWTP